MRPCPRRCPRDNPTGRSRRTFQHPNSTRGRGRCFPRDLAGCACAITSSAQSRDSIELRVRRSRSAAAAELLEKRSRDHTERSSWRRALHWSQVEQAWSHPRARAPTVLACAARATLARPERGARPAWHRCSSARSGRPRPRRSRARTRKRCSGASRMGGTRGRTSSASWCVAQPGVVSVRWQTPNGIVTRPACFQAIARLHWRRLGMHHDEAPTRGRAGLRDVRLVLECW